MKRFLILLALWPALAWGGDAFFLSKNGSDANTGKSWAAAKLTVAGIRDSIHYDDTLVFGQGAWYDTYFNVTSSAGDATHQRVYACSSWYQYALGSATLQQAIDSSRTSAGKWRTVLYSGAQLTGLTKSGTINGGADTLWVGAINYGNSMSGWQQYALCFSQSSTADGADSMLISQTSLANVSQMGEYYVATSPTPDSVYFCPYNDISATGESWIATRTPVFDLSGTSGNVNYVTIWGLECKGGMGATIFMRSLDFGNTTDHVVIEYCHVAMAGAVATDNPACIGARRQDDPCGERYSNILIQHDSLGWALQQGNTSATAPPWQNNTTSSSGFMGAGVKSYNADYWHIDSCTFYGFYAIGVHFKNDYHGASTCSYGSRGNTVARSHIFNTGGVGIYEDTYPADDSVYGCVIENCVRSIVYISAGNAHVDNLWSQERFFFGNNTFYGSTESVLNFAGAPGEPCGDGNAWYANIIYNCTNSGGYAQWDNYEQCAYGTCGNSAINSWDLVDYNYWYGGTTFNCRISSTSNPKGSWSTWTGQGFDAHGSNTTNPGFDHPTDAGTMWYRFARSGSSPEISRTYGGQTWTRIGAVQVAGEPPANQCPVIAINQVADNATLTHLPDTLQINITDNENDQVVYWIKLDKSNPPTTQVWKDTVTAPSLNQIYPMPSLDNVSTYYWRVYYNDSTGAGGTGTCTDSTSVQHFHTDTVTYVPPSLTRRGVLIKPGGP